MEVESCAYIWAAFLRVPDTYRNVSVPFDDVIVASRANQMAPDRNDDVIERYQDVRIRIGLDDTKTLGYVSGASLKRSPVLFLMLLYILLLQVVNDHWCPITWNSFRIICNLTLGFRGGNMVSKFLLQNLDQ